MSKPSANSILYRLIEAGQLARQALLVPLLERGLEPGDDAVLFVLADRNGASDADLGEALGLDAPGIARRIERLIERDLVIRRAIGPDLSPGIGLTERGERIRVLLADNWAELENALFGELKKRRRKALGETLGRFVELLRL